MMPAMLRAGLLLGAPAVLGGRRYCHRGVARTLLPDLKNRDVRRWVAGGADALVRPGVITAAAGSRAASAGDRRPHG